MALLGSGRRRTLMAGAAAVVLVILAVLIPMALRAGPPPANAPAPVTPAGAPAATPGNAAPGADGIGKIKHVVIITQENRSFDSYFGTYPGADGIPMKDGTPTVCIPDPANGGCARPFYNSADSNAGGPHSHSDAAADIDGGAMDGFVAQAEKGLSGCTPVNAKCQYSTSLPTDVMGFHDGRDLPNYWAYAQNFTLLDHLFASAASWSLPAHLYLVSEWSAKCTKAGDPSSCVNALQDPDPEPEPQIIKDTLIGKCQAEMDLDPCREALEAAGIDPDLAGQIDQLIGTSCKPTDSYATCQAAVDAARVGDDLKKKLTEAAKKLELPDYAWTDLTFLLHKHQVPWAYYVFNGTEPDCRNDAATCDPVKQDAKTPGLWNPLLYFDTVKEDGEQGNIKPLGGFYDAARQGTLPAVTWVAPTDKVSEHPPAKTSTGQAYVAGIINAVMSGPDWDSTAIFLSWDDWGGFYDHETPPVVDSNGYGLRVPGLIISPYARKGYIDHQVLSQDAYFKFIEDDFLGGERIDPATDGRPDARPGVRENNPQLGDLTKSFDFTQAPLPPLILPNATTY
ncbi:alkaline phosphatase family protein [Pseudarthrobacter sp. NIBRBAC000502771]|uniref:alkaline phosphatase family protein n=1 Tax=Pseudarthrobacter sp. NIBRBAC000502771 TaxID=2590774 RepID=UPI00112FD5A7|nr:alkaline phosphatase family protein [Pseudarthrobacter sp. NIBRBAC000502771]QDG62487.1 phospholipase [Pseudarthrobacter sp. NIBRBAC000502771]